MDSKPIIATTLTGLFLDDTPWREAHKLWFKKYAEILDEPEIEKWAMRENYFDYIDEIMVRVYPNLTQNQRTIKARKTFFKSVLEYLKRNLDTCVNKSQVKYFKRLRKDFNIVLISTTKDDSLREILKITKLDKNFDVVMGSKPNEKDDFMKVFRRFVKNYGKPIIYVDSDDKIKNRNNVVKKYFKSNNILYFVYSFENPGYAQASLNEK